jgi:hypothetical protein
MTFWNNPDFWTFLSATVGLLKLFFMWRDKSNLHKAKLDLSVENVKTGNIEKSASFLGDVISKTQSMAVEAQDGVLDLRKAMIENGVIQSGLRKMVNDLVNENKLLRSEVEVLRHQTEEFGSKFRAGTASLQLCVDRADMLRKEFGKTIFKP